MRDKIKKISGNVLTGFIVAGCFYVSGNLGVLIATEGVYENSNKELNELKNKKTITLNNIEEYQKYISMIKEPFHSEYKDSLNVAKSNLEKINSKIPSLEGKIDSLANEPYWSWLYFLM